MPRKEVPQPKRKLVARQWLSSGLRRPNDGFRALGYPAWRVFHQSEPKTLTWNRVNGATVKSPPQMTVLLTVLLELEMKTISIYAVLETIFDSLHRSSVSTPP